MRATIVTLGVTIVVFGASALPSGAPPLERWTGQEWIELSPGEKLGYTAGLLTGFWFADAARRLEATDPEAAFEFYAAIAKLLGTMSAEEIVADLEALYADRRRLGIPIVPLVVESSKRRAAPTFRP